MPLPEFILNKIMVPKSFKFTRSGFSFALKNSFAHGTITSLKLLADGQEIPAGMITIQGEGQCAVNAQMISPSSPVAFPTGIQYSVHAEYPEKVSMLVLWAETKEAGMIQFTVWKAPASPRKLLRWPALLKKPVRFVLPAIDKKVISKPVLAGLNVDTLPVPRHILQHLKHLPLMVLPVTKLNRSIHSRNGIADKYSISLQGDSLWKNEVVSSIDLEEILLLCESKETRAIFKIDPDQTAPEEITNWLRDLDALKTVRQDSGHDKDGISLSTVIIKGNAWHEWELSRNNANFYGRKVNHFHEVMQNELPWLPVTVIGKCPPSKDPEDVYYRWNQALLQTAGKSIDTLYWQLPVFSSLIKSEQGTKLALNEIRDQFQQMIQRIDSQLTEISLENKLRQAIDLSHFISALDCQLQNNSINADQVDLALLLASLFMVAAENADKIAFITLLNLSQVAQNSSLLRVAWDVLSVHLQKSVFGSGTKGCESADSCCVIRSEDGEIETLVSTISNGNLMNLTILNHHPDQRIKVELESDHLVLMQIREWIQIVPKGEILQRIFQEPRKLKSLVLPPRSILHCVLLLNEDL